MFIQCAFRHQIDGTLERLSDVALRLKKAFQRRRPLKTYNDADNARCGRQADRFYRKALPQSRQQRLQVGVEIRG